jgi:hypothetical protein
LNTSNRIAAALAFALAVPIVAFGQNVEPTGPIQTEARDPWVPPALRSVKPARATEGAELQAQVERKLRESFEAADVSGTGALTREQARAAGLGVVANNFDRIDTTGKGKVTFDDLKRYLRTRGARL